MKIPRFLRAIIKNNINFEQHTLDNIFCRTIEKIIDNNYQILRDEFNSQKKFLTENEEIRKLRSNLIKLN